MEAFKAESILLCFKWRQTIMGKWLRPILIMIAIAFLSAVSYGHAPIIGRIPDLWIGDWEDNQGSAVDLNFFRFTNAFNFDQYISKAPDDEDQSTTNVRWSFLAETPDLITINDKLSLSDPSEALMPELSGKELTNYPNNNPFPRSTSQATCRDIKDSPTILSSPYPTPISGFELNSIITIYASNGIEVSSRQILVRANLIDGKDELVGAHVIYEDVSPGGDWTKVFPDGMFINAFDGAFYIATQLTSGGSIGASGDATLRKVWGWWHAPATATTYVANQVYRAKYIIRTTQADQKKVPNIRMLMQCSDKSGGKIAFFGGNRLGRGPSAPTPVPRVYNVYFGPPDVSSLIPEVQYVTLSWELIDYSTNEDGTNYLDGVIIERFPTPEKSDGTLVKTFQRGAGFAGWTTFKLTEAPPGTPFYGDVTFAGPNASGISIQTPGPVEASGHVNWGQWSIGSTSGVTFQASKLYRTVYTLSADRQNLGKVRLMNNNVGGSWSAELDADSYAYIAQMPTPAGREYSVWFESMPILYSGADVSKNTMTFLFDVTDGRADQSGTTVLSKVELYSYDIP